MKIKIIALIIAISVITGLSFTVHYLRGENKRISSNSDVILRRAKDEMVSLTKRELKKYHEDMVVMLDSFGVKQRNIEHIVRTEYRYRDTAIVKDSLVYYYDTLRHIPCADFLFEERCFTIGGKICKDSTIELHTREVRDSILFSLYREKKCFKKAKYKAIAVSYCKGDTIQVLNNISIVKKGKRRK